MNSLSVWQPCKEQKQKKKFQAYILVTLKLILYILGLQMSKKSPSCCPVEGGNNLYNFFKGGNLKKKSLVNPGLE